MSAVRIFDLFKNLLDVSWGSIADGQYLQRSGTNIIGVSSSDLLPIGTIMDFAGSATPAGWLLCDGSSLLRAGTYAALFGVLGVVYGSVDGTHFNLPDLRGRVVAGKDNMGGTAANRLTAAWSMDGTVLGANGGNENHTLSIAQMPQHGHVYDNPFGVASGVAAGPNFNRATGGLGTQLAGGDGAHPNVQPSFILNKIIKY
jgi:microcystin-dependent protein